MNGGGGRYYNTLLNIRENQFFKIYNRFFKILTLWAPPPVLHRLRTPFLRGIRTRYLLHAKPHKSFTVENEQHRGLY